MRYHDWHVGMKVVCVRDNWNVTYPGFTYPQEGGVYTITAIGSDSVVNGKTYKGVWIALAEAWGPGHGKPEFAAICFRPVQPRATDISIFTAMLTKVPA